MKVGFSNLSFKGYIAVKPKTNTWQDTKETMGELQKKYPKTPVYPIFKMDMNDHYLPSEINDQFDYEVEMAFSPKDDDKAIKQLKKDGHEVVYYDDGDNINGDFDSFEDGLLSRKNTEKLGDGHISRYLIGKNYPGAKDGDEQSGINLFINKYLVNGDPTNKAREMDLVSPTVDRYFVSGRNERDIYTEH